MKSAINEPTKTIPDAAGERGAALTRAMYLCARVAKRCKESGQKEKMYGANQCWNAIYLDRAVARCKLPIKVKFVDSFEAWEISMPLDHFPWLYLIEQYDAISATKQYFHAVAEAQS